MWLFNASDKREAFAAIDAAIEPEYAMFAFEFILPSRPLGGSVVFRRQLAQFARSGDKTTHDTQLIPEQHFFNLMSSDAIGES
ncbi:hypothetical protein P775_02830 [Puniceibacterium antarcticum]|uniref:Uncharacterized protein n=1 Tax=Puniceibacterium antarcticum TaxID=1206336 RepID=A0A2G8RJJ0_9RHOB|nr:hypothetical protein [Puniceibacterium antarcticum]PIL21729.1 hypothetical protein P775_02830 [Puniceibacterium antarcticum]